MKSCEYAFCWFVQYCCGSSSNRSHLKNARETTQGENHYTRNQGCFLHFLVVLTLPRSSHQRCFVKKVFLEVSLNSQENTCARVSFLAKFQAACNFIKKENLPQVFSCKFCEISKNTFSYRTHKTPPVAAPVFPSRAFQKVVLK